MGGESPESTPLVVRAPIVHTILPRSNSTAPTPPIRHTCTCRGYLAEPGTEPTPAYASMRCPFRSPSVLQRVRHAQLLSRVQSNPHGC